MAGARKVWTGAERERGRDSDLPLEGVRKRDCEDMCGEKESKRDEKTWKREKDGVSGTGRLLDGSGQSESDACLGSALADCLHIRKRCWGSVKGGSESSMGSTRRVPLITSS